jgi:acetyltransferase-like isoleucine patch superfamily enzyme
MMGKLQRRWRRFWTRFAGPHGFGRVASWMAAVNTAPLYGRAPLAELHPRGYVAPSARFTHRRIKRGKEGYVGDRVYFFNEGDGIGVELEDRVYIYGDATIQTGHGGGLRVGARTHIHPGCVLSACVSDIVIGSDVDIAARSAIYSFNHGADPGELIKHQGLTSKGPVTIGDGSWVGLNVIVLSGVRIGKGAVIGAGSVVVSDVPDYGIAVGNPARVVKYRNPKAEESDG